MSWFEVCVYQMILVLYLMAWLTSLLWKSGPYLTSDDTTSLAIFFFFEIFKVLKAFKVLNFDVSSTNHQTLLWVLERLFKVILKFL